MLRYNIYRESLLKSTNTITNYKYIYTTADGSPHYCLQWISQNRMNLSSSTYLLIIYEISLVTKIESVII